MSTDIPERPNVVLVFTDDQGFGDVGCFGSPYIETPNLDRMATDGAKFTSFYVGAPICTPSRAALMTGSYPARVGLAEGVLFPGDDEGLHPEEVTIADCLGDAGYATSCIGKWHLGDQEPFLPTNHGFDDFFGIPYSNDMGAEHSGGKYRELPLMRGADVIEAPVDQTTLTRRYTEEAVSFIQEHRDGPFFCYLAHSMPHVPLESSESFEGVSKRGDYGDVIEEIDWSVGKVLETLDELGIEEETLVLFTSDNGPWLEKEVDGGNSGHLTDGKFSVWEGGPRVPAIARWPGIIPAESNCSELVTSMDLLPTLARLAGTSPPDDRVLDGSDVRDVFFDPSRGESPHDHYVYQDGDANVGAIRNAEGWKLHLESGELYHLHTDVEEAYDVATEHPAVVERLRSESRAFEEDLWENARPCGRIGNEETDQHI